MAQSKRIFAPGAPHHSLKLEPKAVPWGTIAVILLALIVILALWGKIPRQTRRPHLAPPTSSLLSVGNSLQA
jgi:hypothetical protein